MNAPQPVPDAIGETQISVTEMQRRLSHAYTKPIREPEQLIEELHEALALSEHLDLGNGKGRARLSDISEILWTLLARLYGCGGRVPDEMAERLSRYPHRFVRNNLATMDDLCDSVAERLWSDPDPGVRCEWVRFCCDPELLLLAARDPDLGVRNCVARHELATGEALSLLVDIELGELGYGGLGDGELDEEFLGGSPAWEPADSRVLLHNVAGHASCDDELISRLPVAAVWLRATSRLVPDGNEQLRPIIMGLAEHGYAGTVAELRETAQLILERQSV